MNHLLLIDGKITKLIYLNQDAQYAVFRLSRYSGDPVICRVTDLPLDMFSLVREGTEVKLQGHWNEHPRYGKQFECLTIQMLDSMSFFLTRILKGISSRALKEIKKRYTESELEHVIENRPEELLNIPDIKEKKLKLIIASWQAYNYAKVLSKFFVEQGYYPTANFLKRVYTTFSDIIENKGYHYLFELIQENPYILMKVPLVSFRTADQIALSMGLDPYSPFRIRACIDFLLEESAQNEGHTLLPEKKLKEMTLNYLKRDDVQLQKQHLLENIQAVLEKMFAENVLIQYDKLIGLNKYYRLEKIIYSKLQKRQYALSWLKLSEDKLQQHVEDFEQETGILLSQEQKEAVRGIFLHADSTAAIIGYAGTGKTTLCKAIIHILNKVGVDDQSIIGCSFTGMAADRFHRATERKAVTIHRLLGLKQNLTKIRPVRYKVVILDEASMVNLHLFYYLLIALPRSTFFLMLGDVAQLPPIGAGNVFVDICKHKLVPIYKLQTIHRQSENSVVKSFAKEIRQGRIPSPLQPILKRRSTGTWNDLVFQCKEAVDICKARKEGATHRELRLMSQDNAKHIFNIVLDLAREHTVGDEFGAFSFQVLTPMRVGPVGTKALNVALQGIFNPAVADKREIVIGSGKNKDEKRLFRTGDKVVHIKNINLLYTYYSDWLEAGGTFKDLEEIFNDIKRLSSIGMYDADIQSNRTRVYNGMVGRIIHIDDNKNIYVLYKDYANMIVYYPREFQKELLDLAYALTVHKAQGSEYRNIVIPLVNSHYIMLNNKWLYTAITRAVHRAYIITQPYAFKRACLNFEETIRYTWLSFMASQSKKEKIVSLGRLWQELHPAVAAGG